MGGAQNKILTQAPVAAGAVRVDPSAWLMLNDDGTTATPLVARDFVVYALPRRNARQHPNTKCQRGVRLGPYANRALSQAPKGLQWTPPVASTVSGANCYGRLLRPQRNVLPVFGEPFRPLRGGVAQHCPPPLPISRRAMIPPNIPPLNGERLELTWLYQAPISSEPLTAGSKLAFAGGPRVAPGRPVAWRPLPTR